MPYLLQQQAAPAAEPSATDLASQIRAQVNQQLKAAGISDQAAKSAADQAAQSAGQAARNAVQTDGQVVTVTKNGKTITVHTPGGGTVVAPVAPQAPVTGTTVPSIPEDTPFDIPPRVENLGYAFLLMIAVIAVGKPLARAFGSIVERRAIKPAMPQEFGARLERIEQGIESVSIEVERISESQRYLLKVQSPTPERVAAPGSAT
jgi:hypothetical protein